MLEIVAVRKAPLLILAVLLFLAKCLQFAIDSTALFCSDSGAFVLNGLELRVSPTAVVCLRIPNSHLRYTVSFLARDRSHAVGDGRHHRLASRIFLLKDRKSAAWDRILASVVLAFDPAQLIDEHMVMAETSAMLAMGLFLLLACQYLREPRLCCLH